MSWRSKEGAKLTGCCWGCDRPGRHHGTATRQWRRRELHKSVRRHLKEVDRKMGEQHRSVFFPVRCLICEKELKIEDCDRPVTKRSGVITNQITYGGVDCVAYGNYGSRVHDPMGRAPLLAFAVCDECFEERKHLMNDVIEEQ